MSQRQPRQGLVGQLLAGQLLAHQMTARPANREEAWLRRAREGAQVASLRGRSAGRWTARRPRRARRMFRQHSPIRGPPPLGHPRDGNAPARCSRHRPARPKPRSIWGRRDRRADSQGGAQPAARSRADQDSCLLRCRVPKTAAPKSAPLARPLAAPPIAMPKATATTPAAPGVPLPQSYDVASRPRLPRTCSMTATRSTGSANFSRNAQGIQQERDEGTTATGRS